MSLRIARWHWVRICMLIAAATASWPVLAGADTGHVVVVIVPSFRPESPPPPRFPAQPPLQWAPPPAMGLTPGLRPPTARCYAGANVCPLAQPELYAARPCVPKLFRWGLLALPACLPQTVQHVFVINGRDMRRSVEH